MIFVEPVLNTTDYKDIIQTYIHIDKKINMIKARKLEIKERYKAACYIHSPMAYDENGISWRHYPSFDTVVNSYVDSLAATNKVLAAMQFKKIEFDKFLSSLDEYSQYLLVNDPNERLIKTAIAAIKKIEKQLPIQYRF